MEALRITIWPLQRFRGEILCVPCYGHDEIRKLKDHTRPTFLGESIHHRVRAIRSRTFWVAAESRFQVLGQKLQVSFELVIYISSIADRAQHRGDLKSVFPLNLFHLF